MTAKLSDEIEHALERELDISFSRRIAMVAMGYIPLLHITTCIVLTLLVANNKGYAFGFLTLIITVYLIPPLAVRLGRPRANLTSHRYEFGSGRFLLWWYTAQCQLLFNRIPFLEELLRLVPGLYSTWMRLWGANIGGLVYWSPGVRIYDRSFLDIGARSVIGSDTKISPHFISRFNEGSIYLVLAPISIGHDTIVGASTLLPAGVQIAPHEQTPAVRPLAPFTHFRDGRPVRTTRFHKEDIND